MPWVLILLFGTDTLLMLFDYFSSRSIIFGVSRSLNLTRIEVKIKHCWSIFFFNKIRLGWLGHFNYVRATPNVFLHRFKTKIPRSKSIDQLAT